MYNIFLIQFSDKQLNLRQFWKAIGSVVHNRIISCSNKGKFRVDLDISVCRREFESDDGGGWVRVKYPPQIIVAHRYAGGEGRASPIRRYASVLQGARGNISFVCGPIADPKTLWNWLPIQFSGGRKRKHCITPVLSYESFNLPSYSLSPSIFITRSLSRFRGGSAERASEREGYISPRSLLYYPLVAEQAMPHSVNNSLCSTSLFYSNLCLEMMELLFLVRGEIISRPLSLFTHTFNHIINVPSIL